MNTSRPKYLLYPIAGIALFVALYVIASLLYPGGSQYDSHANGFSWMHNYWCNLLNQTAINGQPNHGKPVALAGLAVLCISMILFWLVAPAFLGIRRIHRYFIQYPGTLAMLAASLLFTTLDHDLITNLASLLGLVALLATLFALYRARLYTLLLTGIGNLLLVALNNYLYYHPTLIYYLPLVQKITFLVFLLWVCGVCFRLYKREKNMNPETIQKNEEIPVSKRYSV